MKHVYLFLAYAELKDLQEQVTSINDNYVYFL